MADYRFEQWIEDSGVRTLDYSKYWNDEDVERSKEWDISAGGFAEMEKHLEGLGLVRDLENCAAFVKRRGAALKGRGIDLAAGNLWSVPQMFRLADVDYFYCLEFSKHRLLKLGPKLLEHYAVPKEKVLLVYGSFYDVRLPDASLDFALLSQAFHHAEYPDRLLAELRRVLKPGAAVLVVGEHALPEPMTPGHLKVCLKHVVKWFAARAPEGLQKALVKKTLPKRPFLPRYANIFPIDPVSGDHFYTLGEYGSMFGKHGFQWTRLPAVSPDLQSFVLIRG